MKKKAFKYNKTIRVMGASFNGVEDMIAHARQGKPKRGVYVGTDSRMYPCFDSSDYMYEDRYYWNFVFAKSWEELNGKLRELEGMKVNRCDYNKLTDELHPMAYWQGDTEYEVILTQRGDKEQLPLWRRCVGMLQMLKKAVKM